MDVWPCGLSNLLWRVCPYCAALHCTALRCAALRCTALHCTALHCTAENRRSIRILLLDVPMQVSHSPPAALRCVALACVGMPRRYSFLRYCSDSAIDATPASTSVPLASVLETEGEGGTVVGMGMSMSSARWCTQWPALHYQHVQLQYWCVKPKRFLSSSTTAIATQHTFGLGVHHCQL